MTETTSKLEITPSGGLHAQLYQPPLISLTEQRKHPPPFFSSSLITSDMSSPTADTTLHPANAKNRTMIEARVRIADGKYPVQRNGQSSISFPSLLPIPGGAACTDSFFSLPRSSSDGTARNRAEDRI